ncbi:hypothetical protein B9L20_20385 [Serratia marcescens]|nr:hypothetical protein AN699_0228870 [Serratia marcescens]OCN29779.1 hypothetical protein AN701_0228880 [Serratia marcescens]OCN49467.1 hypothetical protein AN658_0229005 [Serratia marcescens]OCN50106.1 hypothetical protein AN660_0228855 [Serratia marcescens]OCN70040.1 hypothetical protein AN664_0228605 [Serratia marcescens]
MRRIETLWLKRGRISRITSIDYRQLVINRLICDMWLKVFTPRHIVILYIAYQALSQLYPQH